MASPTYLGVIGESPIASMHKPKLNYTRCRRRWHGLLEPTRPSAQRSSTRSPRSFYPNSALPLPSLLSLYPSRRLEIRRRDSLIDQVRRPLRRRDRLVPLVCPRPLRPGRQHQRPCSGQLVPRFPAEGYLRGHPEQEGFLV